MTTIVVDYGVGNLASVCKAFAAVGATPSRASSAREIDRARAIVIPGVGHFAATRAIDDASRRAISTAIVRGVPVLGICLGMQWLFDGSTESPETPGLGVLPGTCVALEGDVKVPHVGWNTLERTSRPSMLLRDIAGNGAAYFTHSFAAPVTDASRATTTHGVSFASVVERDRVFGVQWHPEKSGSVGLTLLRNFVAFAGGASC